MKSRPNFHLPAIGLTKRPPAKRARSALLLLGALLLTVVFLSQRSATAQDDDTVFLPLITNNSQDAPAPGPTNPANPPADPPIDDVPIDDVPIDDVPLDDIPLDDVVVGVQQMAGQYYLIAGARSGYPGMPLYTYADDQEDAVMSQCVAECATAWPPLTVSSAEALIGTAAIAPELSTIERDDGSLQVTYAGLPLYRYAGDLVPGEANGEGLDGLWWRGEAIGYRDAPDGEIPVETLFAMAAPTVLADFAEANSINVNQLNRDEWHTVDLQQSYSRPVIVMQPLSARGPNPTTIRVRNVQSDSFEFQIDEWSYLDGWHTDETIHYLAVEAGVHALPGADGAMIQAGTARVNHRMTAVDFAEPFAEAPVVFSQIETVRDEEPATTRQRNITGEQFELQIEEAEASGPAHDIERVGYIAATPGQYAFGDSVLDAGRTPDRVTHRWYGVTFDGAYQNPALLAAMQTTDGGDTAALRYTDLGESGVELFIEEEQSKDDEVWHTTEVVGYLVAGRKVGVAPTPTPVPPAPTLPPTITPVATPTGEPNPPTPTPMTNPEESTLQIVDAQRVRNVYESDGERVEIRIRRSTSAQTATASFTLLGAEDPTNGSATAGDYVLRDEDDQVLDGRLAFAAGESAHTITIEPVADEEIEVPELLRIQLQPGGGFTVDPDAAETTVVVSDGKPGVTADSRVFVAEMTSENGADTRATGLGTLRLSNDNAYALVSSSFNGLTSVQTASHIHYSNPDSGPIIFSIPLGQVVDERWQIEAAFPSSSGQGMLDALFAGRLYINVHSANYLDGEIRGDLRLVESTTEPGTPPPPPASIEPLTGDALERDIAHFLQQATFGPTVESVADMKARVERHNGDRIKAYEEWIDEQMAMSAPSLLAFYHANLPLYTANAGGNITGRSRRASAGFYPAWYTSTVYGKAQLRERMAFALSEIFVVSHNDFFLHQHPWATTSYYDMLKENAFGPYKTLLTDVSTHPAMGWYLSHIQNQAELRDEEGNILSSPDENYAREVMQLFSIGLVQQHRNGSLVVGPDGLPLRTYTQEDISELARALTGWSYSVQSVDEGAVNQSVENDDFFHKIGRISDREYYQPALSTPLKGFEDNGLAPDDRKYIRFHDNGEKQWLGQTLPAGQTAEQDLAQVMDVLNDHPNTAPFISYRLIQRFTMSNPSADYIYRVATVFEQTDGDLGAVLKAILLDPEARNPSLSTRVGAGKLKEPIIQAIALIRLLQMETNVADQFNFNALKAYGYPDEEIRRFDEQAEILYLDRCLPECRTGFDQVGLWAPTVFNWYQPSYGPTGPVSNAGLVAPELQLADEKNIVGLYNAIYWMTLRDNGMRGIGPQDRTPAARLISTLPTWLLDQYMAVMDTNGDGQITPDDASFADEAKIREASAALVDTADVYLCAGRLQGEATGDPATDPREIIITGVVDTLANRDGRTVEFAADARDDRVRETLYLVASAPQCSFSK